MTFTGVNYVAVALAAIVAWIGGAVWYNLLGRQWIAAQGRTVEAFRADISARGATWLPYAATLVLELVMAWVFAGLLGHLGPGEVTIGNGIVSALFVWIGFVLPVVAVNNLFGMRRAMLTIIDSGHWLLALILMGAVLGWFGAPAAAVPV